MNDFSKIYTAESLKKHSIVSVFTLPMEESVMFPVAQIIDLMKQGENVIFFSFNHDSIKINTFFQNFLKNELKPETIKGNLAVIDAHQIPAGIDWVKFVEETIIQTKKECTVNYVFMDLLSYVKNHPVRPSDDEQVVSVATLLSVTQNITFIILKTINIPVLDEVKNPKESKKVLDEMLQKNLSDSLKEAINLTQMSDLILGIQRERKNFWKSLINFLLFWRKRNNFTVRIMKNRYGKENSYKMNLDMETFKSEIL